MGINNTKHTFFPAGCCSEWVISATWAKHQNQIFEFSKKNKQDTDIVARNFTMRKFKQCQKKNCLKE